MFAPGEVVDGKFRVVRLIGEGGMGGVYEARRAGSGERVAIKVLHASVSGDRDLVARFEREATAGSRVASPHIAEVFDFGELPTRDRYLVMEYLDGESLQTRLEACGRLSPEELIPLALQILDGLEKVHEADIIHRDLKPANIFLSRGEGGREIVKIIDFGTCKLTAADDRVAGALSTGIGELLGTLPYMAPEQLEHGNKLLEARADLYSVGVILYRCLAGTVPYPADNVVEMLRKLREGRPPDVRELAPDVDEALGKIVHQALDWSPAARFSTAGAMRKALLAVAAVPSRAAIGAVRLVRVAQAAVAENIATRRYTGSEVDEILSSMAATADLEPMPEDTPVDADDAITLPRRPKE